MEQHEGEDDNDAVNNRLEMWLSATNSGQIVEEDEDANWMIIGFCLKRVLAPVLRNYVKPVISALYHTLKKSNNIHTQSTDYLAEYPDSNGYKLNYANINNNKNKRNFDYRVMDEIELSKLFVTKKMARYRDVDTTCDLAAILSLITNVSEFRLPLRIDARKVREEIRNRWAHPEDFSWDDAQVEEYFTIIQQCIRSLQLPEKEESKILYHVLELRFYGKEKIRSPASMKAIVQDIVEEHLYKQISQGEFRNCRKCKTLLRQESKNDESKSDYAVLSSEALKERWVCLIKLYPWFKDQMTDSHARCIASQTLNQDQTEIVWLSKFRRMTVDALLKPVLSNRTIYLSKFLRSLETHWEPNALQNRFKDVQPSPEEIEGCMQLNECLSFNGTNRQISCENLCRIEEPDKQTLLPKMKGIKTIDTVNNSFLARFFFSLGDHDSVCDHLHKLDFGSGAIRLFATMEKCPKQIMACFCDLLESLEETSDIVRRMELRQKYCHEKRQEKGLFASMLEGIVRLNTYAQTVFEFDVDGFDFGSIIFRLRPQSLHSWGKLKRKCSSGDIINMLNEVFLNEMILNSFNINEKRLLITIYSEASVSSENTAHPTALLTMELSSENRFHAAAVASEEDPIRRHLEVFCEELEISDELIKLLELKELIPSNIKDQLKRADSRSSEIRCLLESISETKKGYEVLKEYLRYTNGYIHQLLVESDKHVPTRELVFQCEAQLKQKKGDAYSKSAEKSVPYIWVLINKKSYFEENASVSETENSHQHASDQKHPDLSMHIPKSKAVQESDEKAPLCSVKVAGISKIAFKDTRELYFESPSKSGGGSIKNIDEHKEDDLAIVRFENETGIVPSTTEEDLLNFLKRGNGGVPASSLEYGEQKETVLVTFGSEIGGKGASGEVGKIMIVVIKGDIASLTADIIVDTTAKNLDLRCGAVSKSILYLGGEKIQQQLNTAYPKGLGDNEIAISEGVCRLKCKYILHGWLMNWNGGEKAISALQNFMCNCLKEADKLQAISIAFPAIGTGELGYPCDTVAKEMFSAVRRFERDHPMTTLREAMFVVFHTDLSTLKAFEMEQGRVA